MDQPRIYLQKLPQSTRQGFGRLASARGWAVVDALPADVAVLGASEQLETDLDDLTQSASQTSVVVVGEKCRASEAAQAGAQAHVSADEARAVAATVQMLLDTIRRNAAVHPLTGLPGSPAIQREIEHRLPKRGQMGCVYCDIDNFKAFNDAYGFERGDRMILSLKELIHECARSHDAADVFVGHIGGDDFMTIAKPQQAEAIGRNVVAEFAERTHTLADEVDRDQGFIEIISRTGQMQRFPLPTLTAVMVTNEADDIHHPGRVSAILAELKAYVKTMEGSNFFRDRREHHNSEESLARKPE